MHALAPPSPEVPPVPVEPPVPVLPPVPVEPPVPVLPPVPVVPPLPVLPPRPPLPPLPPVPVLLLLLPQPGAAICSATRPTIPRPSPITELRVMCVSMSGNREIDYPPGCPVEGVAAQVRAG